MDPEAKTIEQPQVGARAEGLGESTLCISAIYESGGPNASHNLNLQPHKMKSHPEIAEH